MYYILSHVKMAEQQFHDQPISRTKKEEKEVHKNNRDTLIVPGVVHKKWKNYLETNHDFKRNISTNSGGENIFTEKLRIFPML